MLRSAKLYEGRNVVRFVLIAVSGLWLSGCSSDAQRMTEAMNQPFSNPFASTPAPSAAAAPTPQVSSQPLSAPNTAYQAPAHPSPVASAPLAEPAPVATGSIRPTQSASVGGSAAGWSAVGGSPVLVIQGDTAESLSRRYGVPTQALLGANGLSSASQVHPGMHVIVPVYNARAAGSNAPAPIPVATETKRRTTATADAAEDTSGKSKAKAKKLAEEADAEDKASRTKANGKTAAAEDDLAVKTKGKKKKPVEEAEATPVKGKKDKSEPADVKAKDKTAEAKSKDKAELKTAEAKADKKDKTAEVKTDKKVAKADLTPAETTKVPGGKGAAIDNTPTARTAPNASTEPVKTAEQADASGANPEFRWPARGRVIQGFKSGGNDGINIAVPEGTSVRAAESGVVAYAGSELKGYGNLILIRHPNGFVTAYANNGEIGVKRGEQVKRGQVIAKSGESGNVSTPQLHFELRDKAGQPVDPTNYLAGI